MTQPAPKLSVDAAVAQFHAIVREELGPPTAARSSAWVHETPEQADAHRFRFAEGLLRLACRDPTPCADHRCRRGGLCRHLADLRERRRAPRGVRRTRRSPGAAALRHAIWVYMNVDCG